MAKRTFLQLAQRVYQDCSAPGSVPASVTNQVGLKQKIVDWTADAIYEIEALWGDWKFLKGTLSQSLVAATNYFAYPSDWSEPHEGQVYIAGTGSNFYPLGMMDYDYWWITFSGLDSTDAANQDRPTDIIYGPDYIYVYPTPDAAYTLKHNYNKKPTRVTANGSYSNIPEEFESAIIALAKMKFAEHDGAGVMLANAQQEYNLWLSNLEANQRPNQRHRRTDNTEQLVVRAV